MFEGAISGPLVCFRATVAGDQRAISYLRAILMLVCEPLSHDPRWSPLWSIRTFLRLYVDDITIQAMGTTAFVLATLPLLANSLVEALEGELAVTIESKKRL